MPYLLERGKLTGPKGSVRVILLVNETGKLKKIIRTFNETPKDESDAIELCEFLNQMATVMSGEEETPPPRAPTRADRRRERNRKRRQNRARSR